MIGWAHFDGMAWNAPDASHRDLEWRLRYGAPTKADLLRAASVLAAYDEIIHCPRRKREYVVRQIRAAMAATTYSIAGDA
jgi:hypothetical protein